MYQFHNNFIGYRSLPTYKYQLFSGSDSKELFEANLKTMPDDWIYRTLPIEYNRNSLGHRCKELSEIDLDNYILVTGCSHTEGIGLPLENSYAYELSKKFKCDYYNLGLAGSGIDIMMHNLTVWLSTVKKQPKFVVMQFPDVARFSIIEPDQDSINIDPAHSFVSVWTISTPTATKLHTDFILLGEDLKYFDSKVTFARAIAKSIINVPIIEVHVNLPHDFPHQLAFKGLDFARDGHFGILSNFVLAGDIAKTYRTLIKNTA